MCKIYMSQIIMWQIVWLVSIYKKSTAILAKTLRYPNVTTKIQI
jgi:hypothetical protein